MENNTEKIFTGLKDEVSAYIGLKLRLWKLMAIGRAAELLSSLSFAIVLVLFTFFTLLFMFIALGLFWGEWLGSMAWGFLWVSMLYFLLGVVFVMTKGGICCRLTNVYVKILQTKKEKNNGSEENQSDHSASTVIERTGGNSETMSGSGTEN